VEKIHERVHVLKEERTGAVVRWETLSKVLTRLSERVETLKERLESVVPVSDAALEEAARRTEILRSLREVYPRAKGLVESYDSDSGGAQELEWEIEELAAGPEYDVERYEALREERAGLERLRGRVESLQAQLRERPEVEKRLGTTQREEEGAAREAGRLREELASLAFDEEAYFANREKVAEAGKARDRLREAREDLVERLRRVESRVEALEAEISRYLEQRKAADDRAKEAAKLGEMDALFSEFYKELTARVHPILEEEASGLVRMLTLSRYEKVEFDRNYGIRLYDGLSDAYEISRFSGGEADIVSLAARVALSKIISSRGSEALGFIVLDEVFGALDAQRRRNVLLALDRLKRTFGQIFIISHVADVQESALLDELWMVEEDEEGKSTVRRVDVSSQALAVLPSGLSRAP
jgi:exonuclease SbcC